MVEAERLYRLGLDRCPPPEKWLKLLTRIYLKTADRRKLTDSLQRLTDTDNDNALVRKKLLEQQPGHAEAKQRLEKLK
jgi:hypothetical protein